MPTTHLTLMSRIVDRLAEMAADANYAQRRLFEIQTGVDLSGPPVRETRDRGRRRRGVRTTGAAHTPSA